MGLYDGGIVTDFDLSVALGLLTFGQPFCGYEICIHSTSVFVLAYRHCAILLTW